MEYIIAIFVGYLFGCSSMSFYISKIKNVKLKENGSKNYGASNTLMLIGKRAAILVLIHDVLKSFLAMKLIEFMFEDILYVGVVAGIFAILGHIFPFYLKFDGGKGFASYIGLLLGLNPLFALINIFIILIVSFLSNYIVGGTFYTILFTPLIYGILNKDYITMLIMYIPSIVIFIKHKENIKKILKKEEPLLRDVLFKKK